MEKLRKISTMYYLRQIVACLLVYCILLAVPMQVALAEVVMTSPPGPITVTPLVAGTQSMTAVNGAIGSFSDFDIAAGNSVNCVQTTNLSNALFKVFGDGTEILGSFTANGNIFLIDPAGIIFGPNSQINVNRLVASGLNMENQDFLDFTNGTITKMKFQGGLGTVTNEGTINAADSAYLVGTQVLNTGTITSPVVVLAAGEKVYLNHLGSNVFIEPASDLETPVPANNTVNNSGTINATGQVVLAAGDIISAAITGVDSLAAVANRNIALGGDFEAGEITLTADADGVDGGRVYAGGIDPGDALTSTTGDIEISASDITMIQLNNVDIDAAEDLLLNNNTTVSPGKTLKAGQDVILADSKTMKGYGALTVEADRDIILGGAVHAYGTMTLKADADTVDHEPGATTGGIMWAKSTLRTMFGNGNIDIYGNAILLDNHVTAAQDLILNNNTYANPGITLKAGNNVDSPAHLTSEGNLTIEATYGAITAHEIKMPAAPAPDATLTLTQNDTLDLEQNVTVVNRTNTHLVAKSTGTGLGEGSVTSIAAAQWKSITAAAQDSIILSDIGGDITTKVLTATTGNIEVTTDNYGQLLAKDNITAYEGDVALYADDGIVVAAAKTIEAGRDVKIGYDEGTQAYDSDVTLTGEGALTVIAGDNMTFGGDVEANGNLFMFADNDGDDIGDVLAMGSVKTTNSNLYIESENIQIDGAIDIAGWITMFAEENITLGSDARADDEMWLYANYVYQSSTYYPEDETGDLSTKSLNATGISLFGQNIDVDGTVYSDGTGSLSIISSDIALEMLAIDNITLAELLYKIA